MSAVANPYATQLGNRNARQVIAETPQKLQHVLEQLSGGRLEQSYAPGKWSARVIYCHLADCEIAFSFRLRQALAEPHHVIQPFDQDAWSTPYQSGALQAEAAFEVWSSLRRWNLALLKAMPREAFSKMTVHPQRGEMAIETIIETMAGHDLNHLRQLEQIASA